METPIINSVSKVVKLIDPIDVPGYRMKMIYQQRHMPKTILKPIVGPYQNLYIKSHVSY